MYKPNPKIEMLRVKAQVILLSLVAVIIVLNGAFSTKTYSITFPESVEASVTPEIEVREEIKPEVVNESIEEKVCRLWGSECRIAIAVMKAESQGDPTRIGDKHLTFVKNGEEQGYSVGLFQIRTGGIDNGVYWSRPAKLGISVAQFTDNMLDADKNIEYAYSIYRNSGNSFEKWSTYTNGVYLRYL